MWVYLLMLPAFVYATSCVDSNPNISAMGVLPPCYLASVWYPQANVQTSQSYYFNATTNGSWLVGFTFRQDPGFWTFKNPSLTAVIPYNPTEILQNANLSQGGNIIVNGASISAPLNFQVWFQAGQPPPAAGSWSSGQWYDGAVGTFDGIYQGVSVTQDTQYKISFNLTGTNPSDGKGIQLGVYALPCANTLGPITSCIPPTTLGFGVAVPDSVSPTPSVSISLSNSNSISSSVSSQRTSSVSVSSFASISVSPTGTPSLSTASTPSITSVVSPSVSVTPSITSSVTPSITTTTSITRSKTNSKSLTMSDSTCSTPSPINLFLSPTDTPLFLITAFPTPSLTPSTSMNLTLGGASGGVELGTIMGGVSVGMVGVMGAILAFLHIPRPTFLQNFLKNPIGNITKLMSDIKNPTKAIQDLQEMTQDEEQPTTVNVDTNVVVAPSLPVLSQAQKVIAQSFRSVSAPPKKATSPAPESKVSVSQTPLSPPPQPKVPVSPTQPVSQPKTPITPPVRTNTVQPPAPQKPKQDDKNQKAKIELDLKDLPAIQAYLNSKKTQHKIVK